MFPIDSHVDVTCIQEFLTRLFQGISSFISDIKSSSFMSRTQVPLCQVQYIQQELWGMKRIHNPPPPKKCKMTLYFQINGNSLVVLFVGNPLTLPGAIFRTQDRIMEFNATFNNISVISWRFPNLYIVSLLCVGHKTAVEIGMQLPHSTLLRVAERFQ